MYDSRPDTQAHIWRVQELIDLVVENLMGRAAAHDRSKLAEPEKSGYDQLTAQLRDFVYGSDEYRAVLAAAKPVIDHHYAHNSHHPEHFAQGIAGMSLLDIVEMACDWAAASDRHGGLTIASLEHNRERWAISDQLYSILLNTYRELGWLKDVSK
jgi:Family of unknown function (DUF5662)